ncbi:MAG: hypothetical protein HYV93_06640 [Candidatus Rokubacteria bacterium]|nr:hypothetical protein [Candidatus Rokubacteria bacterium]
MARSRPWEGLAYRTLPGTDTQARELFGFVGAWAPPRTAVETGWAAWDGSTMVAAVLLERAGSSAILHGPVVVAPAAFEPDDALETAVRLVASALEHAQGHGIETVFARPQGLDRVWVRAGFIPVPEVSLPEGLRGRPGLGLFAWRGGSALWSAAGRGAARESRSG